LTEIDLVAISTHDQEKQEIVKEAPSHVPAEDGRNAVKPGAGSQNEYPDIPQESQELESCIEIQRLSPSLLSDEPGSV